MPHQYHQNDKKTYSKSKRYRGLTPLFNIKGKKMESFTNLFVTGIIVVATISITWALLPILKADDEKK